MKKRIHPSLGILIEKFQFILLVMSSLQHDIAMGDIAETNRHAIARAVGIKFSQDFIVVDGYVLLLAPSRRGKKYGEEVFLHTRSGLHTGKARLRRLPHSWLAWKQNPMYLIDVWPVGGVPGASPPVLIRQNDASVWYKKSGLPKEVTEESLRADVERFSAQFQERYDEMFSSLASR